MARVDRTWQAPPFSESPEKRMGWIEEACVNEGENWLQGQTAYSDIPKGLDIISGKLDAKASQQRSSLNINHAKFIVRKIVGTLADVRPSGLYTSDAKFYKRKATMMNRVALAVALESQFPRKLRMALQYMSITARAFIWPRWTRSNGGYGEYMAEFLPLGLLDVLPVQLPADNNLQGAYSVTVCEMVPVWQAHGKYPAFQASLLPIARRRYNSTISARRMDLAEKFKYGEYSENWANLYCEIRHTFIHDLAVNETSMEIPMGEFDEQGNPATSWSYKVPYLGQEIFAGMDPDGKRRTKKAEPEDCMLYPNLRLIRSSKGMKQPMYDGPAPDWSAMVPLASYCADDWPWEPSGFSLVHDIFSPERARQGLERGMDQIANSRLDPAIAYDRTQGLNDATAQTLDPFAQRIRVGVDGDPNKIFASVLPADFYQIPGFIEPFIKYLRDSEDAQLGLNEITNLAEFKASINSDQAMDKALNLVGPLVKDISAGMEAATVDVWKIMKFMIPQFMTAKRAIQYVGLDGVTAETFDFDPEKLIPSHGPDEAQFQSGKYVVPPASGYTAMQRAKMFAQNLRLITVPHTMHEITQMQEQMKWMQLWRGGAPIAFADVAKKLNIDNYGEVPGDTLFERWMWEQIQKLELKAKAAQLEQALGIGLPPPGEGTGPKGGQRIVGGRAPSGQRAPKLKMKTGATGPRVVTSESG